MKDRERIEEWSCSDGVNRYYFPRGAGLYGTAVARPGGLGQAGPNGWKFVKRIRVFYGIDELKRYTKGGTGRR